MVQKDGGFERKAESGKGTAKSGQPADSVQRLAYSGLTESGKIKEESIPEVYSRQESVYSNRGKYAV